MFGMVGVDRQKSREVLVSTCCVYSEVTTVTGRRIARVQKMHSGEGGHG